MFFKKTFEIDGTYQNGRRFVKFLEKYTNYEITHVEFIGDAKNLEPIELIVGLSGTKCTFKRGEKYKVVDMELLRAL